MKVSLVWSSPQPERTIATAMRRCYSTKPIEEIETELGQKGPEYWRFLLTKALQDRSLDVFEHYTMTLLIEDAREDEVNRIVVGYPHVRTTMLKPGLWLMSMNARTLVELWRDAGSRNFADLVVSELSRRSIGVLFNELAFGVKVNAG